MTVLNVFYIQFFIFNYFAFSKLSPGLKIHIGQAGVRVITENFENWIEENVRHGHKIPDHTDKKLNIKFEIRDAIVESFRTGQVSIQPTSNPEITLIKYSQLQLFARNKWSYEVNALLKIKDHGEITTQLNGASITLGVPRAMIVDKTAYVPFIETNCTSYLPSVDIRFQGARSSFYNLIKPLFEPKIRHELQEILCNEAKYLLHAYMEEKTTSFVDIYSLGWHKSKEHVFIDFSFLEGPLLSSNLIQSNHIGRGRISEDSDTSKYATSSARMIMPPDHANIYNTHLHYLVQDEVFNSVLKGLFEGNIIRNFKLSAESSKLVFEQCSTEVCRKILQQLLEKFQAKQVFITLELTRPPMLFFSKQQTPLLIADCNINFHVGLPNKTNVDVISVQFEFEYHFEMVVNPDGQLYFSFITSKNANLMKILYSDIDLNPSHILIFGKVLNDFILVNYVKDIMKVGVHLPKMKNQQLQIVNMETFDSYVIVSANWL